MKNRLPRKFNRIVGKMLIDTNTDKSGDIIHIFKNDLGYLILNKRTGKYAYAFPAMLRDGSIVEFLQVD